MTKPLLAAITLALALTGCSRVAESRLNPFNWFGGRSEPREATAVQSVTVADPRQLVSQVEDLRIEQTPGGAIVTVVGLPPTQGYWAAELVPTSPDGAPRNGVMVYDFRVERPVDFQLQGTPRSRTITTGVFLSNVELQGISQITVRGKVNQRSLRR